MRISAQSTDTSSVVKAVESASVENIKKQGSNGSTMNEQHVGISNKELSKESLQQAVQSMNEFLETNQSTSKFVFHEGLERYYITVVDRKTDEVIKEIPPKKLLDAFYEMQKLVGMIVDEKI